MTSGGGKKVWNELKGGGATRVLRRRKKKRGSTVWGGLRGGSGETTSLLGEIEANLD